MIGRIWHRVTDLFVDEEPRADEEEMRRELQASAPAPELAPLVAARGAELLRVRGSFIESTLGELPGTLFPGLELIGLTLDFADREPLSLKGHGHGEGLKPCDTRDIEWDGVDVRPLDGLEPFASAVGTRLREVTLLTSAGAPHHQGVRLQFERSDVVLLNLWDDIEAYSGLLPEVLRPKLGPRSYFQLYEYPYVEGSAG